MDEMTVIKIVFGLLVGGAVLTPLIALFYYDYQARVNDVDNRTGGQIQLDGIPRQKTRTEYIVQYYRRHKHVDKKTIEALHRYMLKCQARVHNTHDIDDEIEYQRSQKDWHNAIAYYTKYQNERG